jgi:hypothetical protein
MPREVQWAGLAPSKFQLVYIPPMPSIDPLDTMRDVESRTHISTPFENGSLADIPECIISIILGLCFRGESTDNLRKRVSFDTGNVSAR